MLATILVLAAATLQQSPAIHYRVSLTSNRTIDREADDDIRSGTYNVVAFMSASTTMETGKRMAHVSIDSVRSSGTGIMSMAFDSVVGKQSRWAHYDFAIGTHAQVLPSPNISNILTNTLGQVALLLFPAVERGAVTDAVWVDSLDTSGNGDAADRNHPITTKWKVLSATADSMVIEGDVRGTLAFPARVSGSGVVAGLRHAVIRGGRLDTERSTVRQETMMVPENAAVISVGRSTTTVEITALTRGTLQ